MEFDATSRRRLQESGSLGLGIALVVVLVVIVNYFGWKYHQRLDWTQSQLYTLSQKSEQILGELGRDVEAVVLMDTTDDLYGPVRELLSRYDAASARFSVRFVDAQKDLIEAQRLLDRFELNRTNVVVFAGGDDRRVVDAADLADYDYSGLQMGQGAEMTGFKGEAAFTGALIDLVEERKPRILFTTGHGERSIDDFTPAGPSSLKELLGEDNFEIEEWGSLGAAAVPEGTDVIVIAGPTSNFLEPELTLLRSYLEGGGRLLALIDPTLSPDGGRLVETGLEALLADWGVAVGANIVIDPDRPVLFYGAETFVVEEFGDHPITRALEQARLPVLVPLARSVAAAEPSAGFTVTELLLTSGAAWGETDLDALDEVQQDDGDAAGPLAVGVAVELGGEDEPGTGSGGAAEAASEDGTGGGDAEPGSKAGRADLRLVVLGDSDLASNGQLRSPPSAVLLANALNWLVEREALVGIPPKKPEQVRLSLTASQYRLLSWTVLAVLPGLALVLGVVVYTRRRR